MWVCSICLNARQGDKKEENNMHSTHRDSYFWNTSEQIIIPLQVVHFCHFHSHVIERRAELWVVVGWRSVYTYARPKINVYDKKLIQSKAKQTKTNEKLLELWRKHMA